MELLNEPTSKDFTFYAKFYEKKLQSEKDNLMRWMRFTEKRLEDLGSGTDTYIKVEERFFEYEEKMKVHEAKMESPVDVTNELFVTYVTEQLFLKEKQVINSQKKKDLCMEKKQKQDDCLKKFRSNESSHNRQSRQSERDMNHFYERMIRIENEMPGYLREALANMPANKGYIFRGVWYFGHVPVSRAQDEKYLTMFERIKGIQYIHEYIHEFPHKTYNLYEKLSKNSPKKLIRTEHYNMR